MNMQATRSEETVVAEGSRRPRGRRGWVLAVAAAVVVALAAWTLLPGNGRIEVTADEYSFGDYPRQLEPGEHRFQLVNEGDEAHEMVILRLKDGVASVQDLFELSEDEARSKVDVVASMQAQPGERSATVERRLEAGRYALVCFLPVVGNGPPHAAEGMVGELTVS